MSVAAAPPKPSQTRRGPRRARVDLRALGNLMLVASPSLYVALLLIGPVVLIPLYSFGLAPHVGGAPPGFDTANWHNFLFAPDNPFRDRFFRSLLITLV